MIYLFAGDDIKKKLANYERFLTSLSKETEIFFINKNDFDPVQIESFFSGAGLFFNKCVVVFLNLFEKEETSDFLFKKLGLMGESKNIFVFLEGKLKKTELDAFKKARAELNIFELTKEKLEKYNNFLLAYDFEKRDKLNLWIHFREAIEKGVGMEELIGVLFWKAKDLLLKRNFNKFSEEELKNFVSRISFLLPEARKKGLDDEAVFEQFLLEAF
jgi:hypothetical protein